MGVLCGVQLCNLILKSDFQAVMSSRFLRKPVQAVALFWGAHLNPNTNVWITVGRQWALILFLTLMVLEVDQEFLSHNITHIFFFSSFFVNPLL